MSANQSTIAYRQIPDAHGYRAGDDGSVWSCRPINGRGPLKNEWRRLSPRWNKRGYGQVLLYDGSGRVMKMVHHLVLAAFVSPRPEGMEGCHNDGNPANNALSNLRWDTPKGNHADRKKHGTNGQGESNGSAKVTEADVRKIRGRCRNGERYVDVAPDFGISALAVSLIARRKTWTHVED
jgi:hypothetical protein